MAYFKCYLTRLLGVVMPSTVTVIDAEGGNVFSIAFDGQIFMSNSPSAFIYNSNPVR